MIRKSAEKAVVPLDANEDVETDVLTGNYFSV